ncbi:MAG: hypothetical protein QW321_01455 [Candidatus Aenigmatarchaeota archaeon]
MVYKVSIHYAPTIFTVLIFLIGLMIGIIVENYRLSSIRKSISESEIRWNDARLLNYYFINLEKNNCDLAFEENLEYNEKIYSYGKVIEQAIEASRFTPELEQEWRRYTLLQVQFLFGSIELKEKCNLDYSIVIHLFKKKNLTSEEEINNKLQSAILLDLKEKCGRKMMLVPLTADVDLLVVDYIVKRFNVTTYPSVIIDEKVFQGLTPKEELEKYLKC